MREYALGKDFYQGRLVSARRHDHADRLPGTRGREARPRSARGLKEAALAAKRVPEQLFFGGNPFVIHGLVKHVIFGDLKFLIPLVTLLIIIDALL
jgi:hypothetical protein